MSFKPQLPNRISGLREHFSTRLEAAKPKKRDSYLSIPTKRRARNEWLMMTALTLQELL